MAPTAPGATVLNWPVAPLKQPQLDARNVFGWARSSQHHQMNLWILDVDGVEYVSDHHVMIRRDCLTGINRLWTRTTALTPRTAPVLAKALHTKLSSKPAKASFDLRRVTALYLAGAGLRRLAGNHELDLHAVVFGADRVGLAVPLQPNDPELPFGIVPGLPPAPAPSPFVWEER